MDPVLLYAAGVVLMLCLTDHGSEDAQFLGCILALGWVGSNCAYLADEIQAAYVLDLCVACSAYLAYKSRHGGWRSAYLSLGLYQLLADAALDFNWGIFTPWAEASNTIFVLQLVTLGWEGGINVGHRLLGSLRDLCRSYIPVQAVAPWRT